VSRVVVVTGGTRGIGRAVAERFAGNRVIALGSADCDVTDEVAVGEVFERIGPVDVLVNSAGISTSAPLARTELRDWREQLDVNATGAFLCTRAVLPAMLERGSGRIVTVASTAGRAGARYAAAYSASKHAAVGLMRSVAAEVAGTGVTANAVCPGYVDTDIIRGALDRLVDKGANKEEALARFTSNVPAGRLVRPEEVAEAVLYFCSPGAAATTGSTLVIGADGT